MSVITELILAISWYEEIESINKVREFTFDGNFKKLDLVEIPTTTAGGTKVWTSSLYFGAFNHLDLDELKEFLRSIAWENPEYVQLIVREENDDGFKIHTIYK